ncbi:hypothetical protein CcaverHIS002_0703190 [Cutaneotrichosporon cavernicola]|uniref:FAD/NAD(P)-binding domain-containing protein n=1 Tax=Cutaneotrichosporon cavernicola TaxID=279322 RepID=A0AA48L9N6_9TREE|nr:uncharacterized protein CcaverHIS019_0703270 [Cutaneotrichosporon cavernicola]BEI86973.1 hypothetical protein CcaverHIS002_0703190 [Cutaneotrichosporon cavernicola]BEI94746.1 hypothetical protein CcaverHIS019_0703270 [Cutaneotrichosporon cavernicola]BEJ02521.1 hypothetical protein CcaverHIS631_0703160 [Cutaneotrichosporon cavernicola]BEJ10279.1 hypothetical protein CcaverHIS641_0703140 [Cutaneotrichosporon cavernicola]
MTVAQPELKNIVIVGASAAGHTLANSLAPSLPPTHRIVLIERSEFVVHMPTIVRALVVPGWEDKNLLARITQDTVFPSGSRHVVLTNNVVALGPTSLTLERAFEGSTELAFDKVVLATGASQPPPMRPVTGSSMDEYKSLLRKMQAEIKAASSIVVVGGGTVGVEVAGEINALYPEKQLTIVHGQSGLLHPGEKSNATPDPRNYVPQPTAPRVSTSLESQLHKRGVKLVFDDRVASGPNGAPLVPGPLPKVESLPLVSGGSVEADFVFMSTGNIPNSDLIKAADPSALTPSGHIAVDAHFRVLSTTLKEAYALGDVASVPAWKTLVSAAAEGTALAKILAAEIKDKVPSEYQPAKFDLSSIVTLGPPGGAGVLVLPWFGEVGAPGMVVGMKNGDFFAGKSFYARFKGADKVPTTL